jgi:hypothetical protein
MILAAASIQNPSYVPTNYQTFLRKQSHNTQHGSRDILIVFLYSHDLPHVDPRRHVVLSNEVGRTGEFGRFDV